MRADETKKHYKVGYVSGSFDLFHIGHLNLIRRAKERCDYLIVGVLPDDVIFARKRKWPVIPLKERMEIVAAIRYVDRVDVTTMELTPRTAAQKHFGFDAFFTGDDYKGAHSENEQRALGELGADLVFFPYTKDVSTTAIQEKTLPPVKQDAARPTKLEGVKHLFPFDKVAHGEKIVIYGTGDVATQYHAQLAALSYCEIAAFTDTSCEADGEFLGFRLTPPERLLDGSWYGRVVIASTRNFAEIAAKLRAMGIPCERIV